MSSSTPATRRKFLKQLGSVSVLSALPSNKVLAGIAPANTPPTSAAVQHRAPLAPNAFYPLPLGSVRPSRLAARPA